MRHFLIAAAALALGGFVVSAAANAQTFEAGGPVKVGNMCKNVTSMNSETEYQGYYAPCGSEVQAQASRRHNIR